MLIHRNHGHMFLQQLPPLYLISCVAFQHTPTVESPHSQKSISTRAFFVKPLPSSL